MDSETNRLTFLQLIRNSCETPLGSFNEKFDRDKKQRPSRERIANACEGAKRRVCTRTRESVASEKRKKKSFEERWNYEWNVVREFLVMNSLYCILIFLPRLLARERRVTRSETSIEHHPQLFIIAVPLEDYKN